MSAIHKILDTFPSDEGSGLPESEWMSESAIAEEVEKRFAQFAHQPPVLIHDTVRDVLGDAARNDGIMAHRILGNLVFVTMIF